MNRKNALNVVLIRHGKTYGNSLGRYIGFRTDEALCQEGRETLQRNSFPPVEKVFASPLKRCLETAEILYPGMSPLIIEGLRECDFGIFENKNAMELRGEPLYQQWIDSGGTLPFPEGESQEEFKGRSLKGFEEVLTICKKEHLHQVAVIAHGGTIMSIMEAYAKPEESYFSWQVENGKGYELYLKEDVDHEMDHASSGTGVPAGSSAGGSQVDVSSSENHREFDFPVGNNYKELFA